MRSLKIFNILGVVFLSVFMAIIFSSWFRKQNQRKVIQNEDHFASDATPSQVLNTLTEFESNFKSYKNISVYDQFYYLGKHGLLGQTIGDNKRTIDELSLALQNHKQLAKELRLTNKELLEHVKDLYLNLAMLYIATAYPKGANTCQMMRKEIFPLTESVTSLDRTKVDKTMSIFKEYFSLNPDSFRARWLLNLFAMQFNRYNEIPEKYRIKPEVFTNHNDFPHFKDITSQAGLDICSSPENIFLEDMDNDGWLDLMTVSPIDEMKVYHNNHDGTFTDISSKNELKNIRGGGMVLADYDNDGLPDIFIMNSGSYRYLGGSAMLLHNNGDGRFSDVTAKAGLSKIQQAVLLAVWFDYNNDGYVDILIGGSQTGFGGQLFKNNGDGTFTDVTKQAGLETNHLNHLITDISVGDYDNDGYMDIYVTNSESKSHLYHNNSGRTFTDLTSQSGLTELKSGPKGWFWDFNNDGRLDILAFASNNSFYEKFFSVMPAVSHNFLYLNNKKYQFQDVTKKYGLNFAEDPQDVNVGDLNNDGFLDFYISGRGIPDKLNFFPNTMYLNENGEGFIDVTSAGRFGYLNGAAIIFGDVDNDGNQDIFQELCNSLTGGFCKLLLKNPGFGNNWITIKLVGVQSNRSAIGAKIRLVINENGKLREIYRYVTSESSRPRPFRQEIGVGKANKVDELEVNWPASGLKQTFKDVEVNQFITITEGKDMQINHF